MSACSCRRARLGSCDPPTGFVHPIPHQSRRGRRSWNRVESPVWSVMDGGGGLSLTRGISSHGAACAMCTSVAACRCGRYPGAATLLATATSSAHSSADSTPSCMKRSGGPQGLPRLCSLGCGCAMCGRDATPITSCCKVRIRWRCHAPRARMTCSCLRRFYNVGDPAAGKQADVGGALPP